MINAEPAPESSWPADVMILPLVQSSSIRELLSDFSAPLLGEFHSLLKQLQSRKIITSPFDPASGFMIGGHKRISGTAVIDAMRITSGPSVKDLNGRMSANFGALGNTPNTTERARMQSKGRCAKSFGDLCLLAGLVVDALKQ